MALSSATWRSAETGARQSAAPSLRSWRYERMPLAAIPIGFAPAMAALVVAAPEHFFAPLAVTSVLWALTFATLEGARRGNSSRVALGVVGMLALANVWLPSPLATLAASLVLGCSLFVALDLASLLPKARAWRVVSVSLVALAAAFAALTPTLLAGFALCAALHVLIKVADSKVEREAPC